MSNNLRSSVNATGPVTVEAKSLEQALVKAAGTLGLTQDEVEYKIVKEETARGLFSFFKSPVVVIQAWAKRRPQQSRQSSRRSERVPSRERHVERERPYDDEDAFAGVKAEPLTDAQVVALTDELREFCAGICSRIAGESGLGYRRGRATDAQHRARIHRATNQQEQQAG